MIRRIALAGAMIGGLFGAGLLAAGSAQAMTITTPAGLAQAAGEGNVEQVRYVCRRVWTNWGWRRSCWWRPNYYRGYYPYYSRPYYRPYRSYRPYRYGYYRPYRNRYYRRYR